jgi:CDP-diacylglycerol--glycerol-3-phosphate 3-phosphatidyltransferase
VQQPSNKSIKIMTDRSALLTNIFEKGKVFTFSNFLSFIRIPLALYLYYLISERLIIYALITIIIVVISDFADGYFARKWNQVSELGKIFDPVGDKFCVALGSIALYNSFGLPLWVVILIIGRDILILLGSVLLVTRLPFVAPSKWLGKIAVTVISLLLISYLLEVRSVQVPLQILTIIAILASGGQYAINFYQKYFTNKKQE